MQVTLQFFRTMARDLYLPENVEILSQEELNHTDLQLIKAAEKATHSSYSPYSNFQVGAAVQLEDNTIVIGANQENASYPEGLCAERVAVFSTSSQYPGKRIQKLAVVGKNAGGDQWVPVTPCGGCRQVLLEFEINQDAPIEMLMLIGKERWLKTKNARVLLPFAFTKKSIGWYSGDFGFFL